MRASSYSPVTMMRVRVIHVNSLGECDMTDDMSGLRSIGIDAMVNGRSTVVEVTPIYVVYASTSSLTLLYNRRYYWIYG
ncbi:hypothetical protein MUK42_33235 [Musa troglodytarum]|uniref:Uncharacterized protein n=1 Tax=Musa troglodytarum TaxID=320322 RepID=A0A9E7KEL9_9LILI|nr:hypothetical protein MUK42_33235 [Musa troglodytarum]